MKKIYFLYAIILCLPIQAQTYFWQNGRIELVQTSCEIRFYKIPAENFSSLAKVTEMNNSLYWMFGQDKSYRNRLACGFQGYNTDIEYHRRSNQGVGYCTYDLSTGIGDLSTSNHKDPWTYLAKSVYNASMIIEGIEKYCDTTNTSFAYCLGEALFLRAFALSEMVKLWGDVPATWKIFDGAFVPTQAKQERNILYESMRADLKRAAKLLPWSSQIPNYDRSAATYREPTSNISSQEKYMEHPSSFCNYTGAPSKAAALGLLARIDLNYAGYAMKPNNLGVPTDGFCLQLNLVDQEKRRALYQEVLESCAQIIQQEGSWKLLANYEDVFKRVCADVTDYTQSEVIWEIPFANGVRGQYLQYNCTKADYSTQGFLKNNQTSTCNSAISAVPTLYYDFESADKRRDVTITPYAWYYDDGNRISSSTETLQRVFPAVNHSNSEKFLYQSVLMADSWYFGKCRIEWMARDRASNDDGVNVPIIRFADILLMFCEASLGGITGDVPQNNTGLAAQSLFNQIRTRAGLSSKTLNMSNLMAERKFEFAGEGVRKYDLIRWGKLRSSMEQERNRLNNLNLHTGDFVGTSDTIYVKYRLDNSGLSLTGKCYVIDAITHQRPANYETTTGWFKKCVYESYDGRTLSSENYVLYPYDHPEYLDNHQLWPIFDVDIKVSNGLLWNDYNY